MTHNLTSVTELRELIKIADALESVSLANLSYDGLIISDINGDPIAEYRYVSSLDAYTFVFDGQKYEDEEA